MSQTIDQIFLTHTTKTSEKIALTDGTGAARLGLANINQLTYGQAGRYIRHTAAFFRQLGFAEGDVIAVQLPHIAETPLLLLALVNAGLVPCLLPGHWRQAELSEALPRVKPRAIIAHQCFADYDPFEAMFDVAASNISLRFVFGIGADLPDGVTPLPDLTRIISTEANIDDLPEEKAMLRRSGEQVAFISWSKDENCAPAPVAYTHIQLMANTHLLTSLVQQDRAPAILTTYSPTNPVGLIGAFMPWILEHGTLHIASSLKLARCPARISEERINIALIPEGLQAAFISSCLEARIADSELPHLLLVAPTPHQDNNRQPEIIPTGKTTRLYNLNGLCLLPRPADEPHRPGLLHLGNQPGPDGETFDPPFIEARIQGATQRAGDHGDIMRGRLELNGTAIGFSNWADDITTARHMNFNTHWEKTGLTAAIIDQALTTLEIERPENGVYYASNLFNSFELDRLYQAYPGFVDAAAFSIADATIGDRLLAAIIPQPGIALSYEDFKNHLLAQNVSPAKIPEKLVTVEEIPRNEDGVVARASILSP